MTLKKAFVDAIVLLYSIDVRDAKKQIVVSNELLLFLNI